MDYPLPEWELYRRFTIPGDPQSQPRHRHASRGGFVKVYDPAAKDKEAFAAKAILHSPQFPLTGPLRVDLDCFFSYNKSEMGTGRNAGLPKKSAPLYYIKKPDKDNLEKFVFDSLTGMFWHDDNLICAGDTTKAYSLDPRTVISIYRPKE